MFVQLNPKLEWGCLFLTKYSLLYISFFHLHKIYFIENSCPQYTNLTLQVIVRQRQNHVEWKAEHSKTSTSVMFCLNASGRFLPPMVVYKANVYPAWIKKEAPSGTSHETTKSGWFFKVGFWSFTPMAKWRWPIYSDWW